jgi:hypothetical protein
MKLSQVSEKALWYASRSDVQHACAYSGILKLVAKESVEVFKKILNVKTCTFSMHSRLEF